VSKGRGRGCGVQYVDRSRSCRCMRIIRGRRNRGRRVGIGGCRRWDAGGGLNGRRGTRWRGGCRAFVGQDNHSIELLDNIREQLSSHGEQVGIMPRRARVLRGRYWVNLRRSGGKGVGRIGFFSSDNRANILSCAKIVT
jgi:hypothetical protein